MRLIRLKLTLLGLLMLTLVACQTTSQLQDPKPAPIRPEIEAFHDEKGSVCFTEEDAEELFLYILALEKGYE